MFMSAQLIIKGSIFLQTIAVAPEPDQRSWKLLFGCGIPPRARTFLVTALRHSKTEGIRLLGHAEITREEILRSAESNLSFELELNKVNPDGPTLKFRVGSWVSEVLHPKIPGLGLTDIPENTMTSDGIRSELQEMYEETAKSPKISMDPVKFWVMHERILLCKSDDIRAQWLNILGAIFLQCYQTSGTVNGLNQAVCAYNDAVRDDPGAPIHLADLGNSLRCRFEQLGSLPDINRSVVILEAAVMVTLDAHPAKPSRCNNLGNSLLSRFKRLGDLADLNQSVLRFEAAVELTPDGHPSKPLYNENLGISLRNRFERLGTLPDIDRSVVILEAAIMVTPNGHPEMASRYNNLGNSLRNRFERLGSLPDINRSVMILETAVMVTPDSHPAKPSRYSNLGNSLRSRFKSLGDLADINQAVLSDETAVGLTQDGHPDKPSRYNNLGISLLCQFERLGSLPVINQSVLRFETAVALTPDGHPNKPLYYTNLGNSLRYRFEQLGSVPDINQSVVILETAVMLTPDGHPVKPLRNNNLGNSLLRRFKQLGDLADINQAVLSYETAVMVTPDGHPDKPSYYNNLGNSLLSRFERLHSLPDINQSVLRFETAVALTLEGHPSKPLYIDNLGNSLLSRFEQLGDPVDLTESVLRFQTAVGLTPDGHPDRPSRLSNLGNSLLHRFERLGNLVDLTESISSYRTAVKLTPDGHPSKPGFLSHLADSLLSRFKQLHDPHDFQQLLSHYTAAACSITGPPHIRFQAAKIWAKYAHVHHHPSVLHAYTMAIDLLPELAWLGLSISDRHHHILQAGQVVRDAASAAIAVHDYKKAVEWLDQGRSVIWGQLISLRTPVDGLMTSYPHLADQLISLSTALGTVGTRSSTTEATQSQSLQTIAQKSHTIALERDQVLVQIRMLPGFERFLLSKPFSELSLAAKRGPVALLNISQYGCDALILMPGLTDEALHVPLPDFTLREAQILAKSLASIVGGPARSDRLHGSREGYMAPDDIFPHILSKLWLKIVQPVLNGLVITTPVCQDWGRIWWCPTGPLAFLPIHAAGLFGKDQTFGSKLSDFLISSYTPSLTALIQGFRPQSESQDKLQLLAVTQPSADGQCYIPGTQEEIARIQQHANGKTPVVRLNEHEATVDKVQIAMMDSGWVHFACHGVQSASSPTDSALLLAGSSRLTLSNIIQLSLPHADLAFLSACQTAMGSKGLEDESVHLSAGMLLAGYRGVIGTMWSIMDSDAPQVASDVYAHLFKTSPPDSTQAAEALHLAVRRLQEQPGVKKSFLHWVPFIHFGI
ncbi:TPR-like protein [Mycena epipterygia]|nr:TPR-like protein [Mycena epipterygia]